MVVVVVVVVVVVAVVVVVVFVVTARVAVTSVVPVTVIEMGAAATQNEKTMQKTVTLGSGRVDWQKMRRRVLPAPPSLSSVFSNRVCDICDNMYMLLLMVLLSCVAVGGGVVIIMVA